MTGFRETVVTKISLFFFFCFFIGWGGGGGGGVQEVYAPFARPMATSPSACKIQPLRGHRQRRIVPG